MNRLVSLTTGQWADMSLDQICSVAEKMGYDGLELACWGNAFNVEKAYVDEAYLTECLNTIKKHHLIVTSLSMHIIGQCVSDLPDPRLNNFAPEELANKPEEIKKWASETMKKSAVVANKMGVKIISCFTGSPLWRYFYSYPQTTHQMIEDGFHKVREDWLPILDVFKKYGIKYALEVHPGEIAFDYYSTKRLLEEFKDREEFGINFDPSHLLWQGIKPDVFLDDFINRIYNIHMKDVKITLDGRSSLLGSYLDFGDRRRGWNFRSLGHGDVDFEEIIRVLNDRHWNGPLTVEWEDNGMNRLTGAAESLAFVRRVDFAPSDIKFDESISSKRK